MEESNRHAFHSVLHTSHDTDGRNGGYGGGEWSWFGPRDWTKEEYGPGGSCVDTSTPFRVHAAFPQDAKTGALAYLKTTLSQNGCSLSTRKIGAERGRGGTATYDAASLKELTGALQLGVTPVVSQFSPSSLAWLVGEGKDKAGPCTPGMIKSATCGDAIFSDFQVHKTP